MGKKIKKLLEKSDRLIEENNSLLFDIYEFILDCEGLAPLN